MRRLAAFRSGVALFLLALAAVGAQAQPFTVVSSQPADHTAGVPLQTTLSLTFSERVLDYESGFNTAPTLVVFPAEAAVVGFPTRSADGLTLTFALTLQPDTRYVALLLGAQTETFAPLTRPFAVNFTTAATNGAFTVRGNVSAVDGLMPDGSIVALVTGDVATGDVQLVNADVVEGSAASLPYVLGPVPFGLYTAGALLLPFGSSPSEFPVYGYGLYDPDGDGAPNPIFATTGIDLTLAPPPPRTAGEGYAEVQAAADEALGEPARLTYLLGQGADTTGAAPAWSYDFEDSNLQSVTIRRVGLFVLALPTVDDSGSPELPVPFVDSDDAVAAADASGGAAFRAAHPGESFALTMVAYGDWLSAPRWTVAYYASGGSTFSTTVPFAPVALEGEPDRSVRPLALRSANPARGAVEATLVLDAPAEARVTVVDARGRTVAVLLDGALGTGAHSVRWAPGAGVPAGVYWLRAEAAGRTEAVAVTRVR